MGKRCHKLLSREHSCLWLHIWLDFQCQPVPILLQQKIVSKNNPLNVTLKSCSCLSQLPSLTSPLMYLIPTYMDIFLPCKGNLDLHSNDFHSTNCQRQCVCPLWRTQWFKLFGDLKYSCLLITLVRSRRKNVITDVKLRKHCLSISSFLVNTNLNCVF